MAVISPEQWRRVKELFTEALERDPSSGQGLVCVSTVEHDPVVRRELERLLDHHQRQTIEYLSRPAVPGPSHPDPRATTFAAGTRLNDRFRIIRFIGKGGMGEVYEAEDEAIGGVRVALKTIRSGMAMDDRIQSQFRYEVQVARRITAPSVCRIHDLFDCYIDDSLLGQRQRILFLTMELLEGESLAQRLHRSGPMSAIDALPLVRDITGALDAAHQAGVVHRDLKASNVMLVKTAEGSARAVLTDFGLALSITPGDRIDYLEGAGTPAYMAPEQKNNGTIDARSDVFSLGVVLYEMVTGKRPFPESSTPTGSSHREEPPLPPRSHVPGLDPRWETAILRCLEIDPAKRYPSAGEVLLALEGPGKSGITRRTVLTLGAAAAASAATWFYRDRRRALAPISITSLAVLPFQNLSGDKDVELLSSGLVDELNRMLSRAKGLRVIARSSSSQMKPGEDLKSIARRLNVGALLMGAVRMRNGRVSVTAHLTNVEDGGWLWSGSYEEDARSLARIRINLCLAIAGALQSRFDAIQLAGMAGPAPANNESYRLYLLARLYASYRTDDGLKRSIDYLLQSIALDPAFPLTFAALADTYNMLAGHDGCPPEEYFPKAEVAAQRALALDATLGEAHVSLGSVCQRFRWDWTGADRNFRAGIELSPGLAVAHHWFAGFLSNMTLHADALRQIQTASELDPLSPSVSTAYAVFLYRARRYEDSIARFKQTLASFPSYAVALPQLGEVYARMGRWDEAIAAYTSASQMGQDNADDRGGLGDTLARAGRSDDARSIAKELEAGFGRKHYSATSIAYVYRGLGDLDRTFYWLNEGLRRKESALASLKTDPANDEIRQDPRFSRLLDGLRM